MLLSDGSALKKFGKDRINIPFVVLQELDKHKTGPGDVGLNARMAIRVLDDLRQVGNLADGVKTAEGTTIRVIVEDDPWSSKPADDQIIDVARTLKLASKHKVIIMSNDINLRVKASLLGVPSEGHNSNSINNDELDLYSGIIHLDVESNCIDQLHAVGQTTLQQTIGLNPNTFIHMRSTENEKHTGVGRVFADGVVEKITSQKEVFGIKSKNLEQTCALDILLDEELPLVTLMGVAGTGKTILGLAAALDLVLNKKEFKKLIIIRPPIPMGRDIGFLPGSLVEKMSVWMGPILDNFEVLLENHTRFNFEHLLDTGVIEIMPPTFIRGRSIMNSVVMVDEAQGLSQHEMKTIVTRMHETSKLIVTGDVRQIDNPKLSALDNGFSYLVEVFKPYEIAGHVTLTQCERSTLAALATQIM